MRRYFLFASASLGLILAAANLSAQTNNATLTGSWQLAFSPTSAAVVAVPAVQFGGLATFIAEGTLIETDTSELVPAVSTPGHGIWQPGPAVGNFYIQFVSLMPNKTGGVQSKRMVTITGTLDTTGNVFHGTYSTEIMTPTGQMLSSSAGMVTGQRMVHPLLP